MTGPINEVKVVDIVYLVFSKTFETVSHKILIKKHLIYRLEEQTVRWVENWLNGQAQRVVIRGMRSSCRPVTSSYTSGVSLGSILAPVLFNIFTNDLDDWAGCTLREFVDDTKLGGVADTSEVMLPSRGILRGWRNGLTGSSWFNKMKCKSCT